MKFPDYRLSMEAALPSSVDSWLRHELDQRGIDSLIYARYIISLLRQGIEDPDSFDKEADIFIKHRSKSDLQKKGKRSEKRKITITEEERKKFAAIEVLSGVTDEKAGIETLVEELCLRLKDSEIQASISPQSKQTSSSSDSSEDSGTENQNPAERYYAAFPSLQGQQSSNVSPSIPAENVWKNNPLVKSLVTETSEEDISSANEDAEIKKINRQNQVTVPRYRKSVKKNNNKSQKEMQERRKSRSRSHSTKTGNHKQKKDPPSHGQPERFLSFPPGFAKVNQDIIKSLDLFDDAVELMGKESPKRANDELCTKVESLLKGMLLPAPEKTYKELQDVELGPPVEQLDRVKKTADQIVVTTLPQSKDGGYCDSSQQANTVSPVSRDGSVSPELQEQEIWYTQPIDTIFQAQDDDNSASKLRLYKRNSYPTFSPDSDSNSTKDPNTNYGLPSSASSPVFERNRSLSFMSDGSDDIWDGSVLIPAWLTEEISADNMADIPPAGMSSLSSSFKSSSPYPGTAEAGPLFSLEVGLSTEGKGPFTEYQCQGNKEDIISSSLPSKFCFYEDWPESGDGNLTPTPVEGAIEEEDMQPACSLSVSLVDTEYLSHFVEGTDWDSLTLDDTFKTTSPRSLYLPSLWQSQILFDFMGEEEYTGSLFGVSDISWWQPLSFGGGLLSQLWDVNMQKRNKFSPWGPSSLFSESQVWIAENTLFLHDGCNGLEIEIRKDSYDESENTLIPTISIDLLADGAVDYSVFIEKETDEEEQRSKNFDRSTSMSNVPSIWQNESHRIPDPKLSKSFELVPSEHSAFYDVPKKLLHVHSEPNLVSFRHEFMDGNQSKQDTPPEHLYFSPKTHFRPITPAYAPELSQSKTKQQVCHDLFGGLPSTKTPYQQYHMVEGESDEEGFIPRFKLKNSSKCIQTGESFDRVDTPPEYVDVEEEERDTPETLTLGMIENVMGEKEELEFDTLIPIVDELDNANTDSAYETDYGISALEYEQDGGGSANFCNADCCYKVDQKCDPFSGNVKQDNDKFVENVKDFTVESFVATFPHTQDWPDGPQGYGFYSNHGEQWNVNEEKHYPLGHWPEAHSEHSSGGVRNLYSGSEEVYGSGEGAASWDTQRSWCGDFGPDPICDQDVAEQYKHIWSSAGQEGYNELDMSGDAHGSTQLDVAYDENNKKASHVAVNQEENPDAGYMSSDYYKHNFVFPLQFPCPGEDKIDEEVLPPPEAGANLQEIQGNHGDQDCSQGDYFSVKLVYKDKQSEANHQTGSQKYGDYDLMPMPMEALMSTDLEKEWMTVEGNTFWVSYKHSSLQRKPCSFFLEGNCRRTDCKFAHDISNITCRFWEEGGCFKGDLCPFLHGYPRKNSSPKEPVPPVGEEKEKFDLNNEEFPELSPTVKNENNQQANKKAKSSKTQNFVIANKKEKSSRKGHVGRRSSNKENRVEFRVMDRCSNSV